MRASRQVLVGRQGCLDAEEARLEGVRQGSEGIRRLFIGVPYGVDVLPGDQDLCNAAQARGQEGGDIPVVRGDPKKAMEHFRKQLDGNDILGEATFIEPAHQDTEKQVEKAKAWAKEMLTSEPGANSHIDRPVFYRHNDNERKESELGIV